MVEANEISLDLLAMDALDDRQALALAAEEIYAAQLAILDAIDAVVSTQRAA
ncbi:MAG: hypothetical protein U1E65_13970 [Myxococcota bacterium]